MLGNIARRAFARFLFRFHFFLVPIPRRRSHPLTAAIAIDCPRVLRRSRSRNATPMCSQSQRTLRFCAFLSQTNFAAPRQLIGAGKNEEKRAAADAGSPRESETSAGSRSRVSVPFAGPDAARSSMKS